MTFNTGPRLVAAFLIHVMGLTANAAAETGPTIRADRAGPVLVDGSCTDPTWGRAAIYPVGGRARVRFIADDTFLYICLEPPPGSFANTDLYIRHEGAIHNLHASAQLGERTKIDSAWPAFRWWNNHGWIANALPFTGVRSDGGARFGFIDGREFQIARSRFRGDSLNLMIEVHQLASPDGTNGQARFPAAAVEDSPETWITLEMTPAAGRSER